MNSDDSANESNSMNFSADQTTNNPLDAKDSLLGFPFDHIYARKSNSSDRKHILQLDKEVEISANCVVGDEKELILDAGQHVTQFSESLVKLKAENKKLKDLVIYHLDLIQQQNDLISRREKSYHVVKQDNDNLRLKLSLLEDRVKSSNQRPSENPPPLVQMPSTSIQPIKTPSTTVVYSDYPDIMLPSTSQNRRVSSVVLDTDVNKARSHDPIRRIEKDGPKFLTEVPLTSVLDNIHCQSYSVVDSPSPFVKKELNKTDNRTNSNYTMASTSTKNPAIQRLQRNRRRSTVTSTPIPTPAIKLETTEAHTSNSLMEDKNFDKTFTVNKKSKMINTYGKCSKNNNNLRTSQCTGSLSDRLQLIDTTPTGDDPYQMGEADLREQSPIPKLMLQKTNLGRMKIYTGHNAASSSSSYKSFAGSSERVDKIKLNRYSVTSDLGYKNSEIKVKKERKTPSSSDQSVSEFIKTQPVIDWKINNSVTKKIVNEPVVDWKINSPVKQEVNVDDWKITFPVNKADENDDSDDWRIKSPVKKEKVEKSLCDFSYGENANNLASSMEDFKNIFHTEKPMYGPDTLNEEIIYLRKQAAKKAKRKQDRTKSCLVPDNHEAGVASSSLKINPLNKKCRQRALSTVSTVKTMPPVKKDKPIKVESPKPTRPKLVKGNSAIRGKKTALPPLTVNNTYHTQVGESDIYKIWLQDDDASTSSDSVEVPRWREKHYSSSYTMEGTEDLDDKVFEKRHQKLETEERRQLRWHMRRVREERHVEKLKQRQRASWMSLSNAQKKPSTSKTIWPEAELELRYIEITNDLPVNALGTAIPDLPKTDFKLPWIRKTKPAKRHKRSKTLN